MSYPEIQDCHQGQTMSSQGMRPGILNVRANKIEDALKPNWYEDSKAKAVVWLYFLPCVNLWGWCWLANKQKVMLTVHLFPDGLKIWLHWIHWVLDVSWSPARTPQFPTSSNHSPSMECRRTRDIRNRERTVWVDIFMQKRQPVETSSFG